MTPKAALALALVAGCTPTQRNHRIASAITLAASTAALACDAGQTMDVARAGWPGKLHEGNWMLGSSPSVATLGAYNAGVASANAAVWWVTPEKYDWILPLALGVLEMTLVAKNSIATAKPFCGLR